MNSLKEEKALLHELYSEVLKAEDEKEMAEGMKILVADKKALDDPYGVTDGQIREMFEK